MQLTKVNRNSSESYFSLLSFLLYFTFLSPLVQTSSIHGILPFSSLDHKVHKILTALSCTYSPFTFLTHSAQFRKSVVDADYYQMQRLLSQSQQPSLLINFPGKNPLRRRFFNIKTLAVDMPYMKHQLLKSPNTYL